jgi:uncharacterized protein DUF6629
MCFSVTASFASCAILTAIGTATMAKARTNPQRLLATMPLLFAFQQFSEGFVWLSVQHAAYAHLRNIAMYSFLIFAQVVWPLFVPVAVLALEKDRKRKKLLNWFAVSGFLAALYFIWCLCFYTADVEVSSYHIKYVLDFPLSKRWFYGIIYFIPAMFPTFVSTIKRMHLLGFLLLGSYLISRFCYKDYIVSVWCFFGALSSITVLYIIMEVVETEKNKNKNAFRGLF